jgi:Domain of unknown function (DU1801)
MAKSNAATVEEFIAELSEDRRKVIAAVRSVIRRNLPKGYREAMNWGMIAYEVPLERYPDTYNKQPLCYAALASQKNYHAVYLDCFEAGPERDEKLRAEFAKAGKKLDMGKACIRFKKLEDLALDVIGRVIGETPIEMFIARYEASRKKT